MIPHRQIVFQCLVCFFHHPRLVLDFDLLVFAFGQIPLVVCTWICMFLSVLVVPFTLFHLWSQTQSGNHSHPRLWSVLFVSIYLLYQFFALGFLPTYIVVTNSLPPASRFIVIMEQVGGQIAANTFLYLRKPVAYISEYLLEMLRNVSLFVSPQVRLMMKAHSFIRENVPRVLTWAKDKTGMKIHPFIRAHYFLVDPMLPFFTVCS